MDSNNFLGLINDYSNPLPVSPADPLLATKFLKEAITEEVYGKYRDLRYLRMPANEVEAEVMKKVSENIGAPTTMDFRYAILQLEKEGKIRVTSTTKSGQVWLGIPLLG